MTIVFLVVTASMIIIRSRREKTWVNLISVLMAPYFVIVLLNNFFIYRLGFYKISNNVLIMLMIAFLLFYLGSIFFSPGRRNSIVLNKEEDTEKKLEKYDINTMTIVLYVIAIISLIRLFTLYRSGQFSAANINDAEGVMSSGIVGHLLLISYSILPIVFLYWTYHIKKIQYLIPILLIAVATFASLIKYHIIGLFVVIFLFMMIYRKSLLKRAIVILVIAVLMAFIGNYALTFGIRGVQVSLPYYLQHLWTYAGGSVIYDNNIFTVGVRVGTGIGYKLLSFLCALPNMFINRFTGEKIFPHVGQPFYSIGSIGEQSNVVDAIGYLFPSEGAVIDIILFGLVIFLIGVLFSFIYTWSLRARNKLSTFNSIFLCYFVFLSFFGTFYVNSGPWEMLIYALIIPNLFNKKKLKFVWKT